MSQPGETVTSSAHLMNWQSDKDYAYRRKMIKRIMQLLRERDDNAKPEWINKLPMMVKQLEVSLYRSAPSFEAYADNKTLEKRLQDLCLDIVKKMEKEPDHTPESGAASAGSQSLQSLEQSQGCSELGRRLKCKQKRLLLLHHAAKCQVVGPCCANAHCTEMKKLWKHMSTCTIGHCKVSHCYSSRSILSHYVNCQDSKCPVCGPVRKIERETPPNHPMKKQRIATPNSDTKSSSLHHRPNRSTDISPQTPEDVGGITTQQSRLPTSESINSNLLTLSPEDLKETCLNLLEALQRHKHGWVLNAPVNPVELDPPDNYEMIKKPMDLGIIHEKIESGSYQSIGDFYSDVKLTFENLMQYDDECISPTIYGMAREMMENFNEDYGKLLHQTLCATAGAPREEVISNSDHEDGIDGVGYSFIEAIDNGDEQDLERKNNFGASVDIGDKDKLNNDHEVVEIVAAGRKRPLQMISFPEAIESKNIDDNDYIFVERDDDNNITVEQVTMITFLFKKMMRN